MAPRQLFVCNNQQSCQCRGSWAHMRRGQARLASLLCLASAASFASFASFAGQSARCLTKPFEGGGF
jgi:hypothetical protein